jgi:hypothetical protein
MNDQEIIFDECLKNSFSSYNYEKCQYLAKSRILDKDLVPMGFYMAWMLIINDVRTGTDGFTGKTIRKYPVIVTSKEIIDFARRYKDVEFSKEVASICNQMSHDKENMKLMFKNNF